MTCTLSRRPRGAGQTGAQRSEPVPAGLPGQRPGPEVATRLFLNHKTIKVRLGHIYHKLGVHSRQPSKAHHLRAQHSNDRPSRSKGNHEYLHAIDAPE
jgi:hypothetical protein